MKHTLAITILAAFSLTGFVKQESPAVDNEKFCNTLQALLGAASAGFESIKGTATERMITGNKKSFFISKVSFGNGSDCYINTSEAYPECECILASDSRITPELIAEYNSYKGAVEACLPTGWRITEQDSTNNAYLKGRKYKKLVVREDITGKKVKFHLYMYSSMIEKKRVVELKIEGIGKKQ